MADGKPDDGGRRHDGRQERADKELEDPELDLDDLVEPAPPEANDGIAAAAEAARSGETAEVAPDWVGTMLTASIPPPPPPPGACRITSADEPDPGTPVAPPPPRDEEVT